MEHWWWCLIMEHNCYMQLWKSSTSAQKIRYSDFIWVLFITKKFFCFIYICLIILICIQQDATLHSLFYLETALHVLGGTTTHHQELKQLYLQHLVLVRPLLLPAAIVEELELVWVCCGWRVDTPPTAHSNQFQLIAADSSNGVTNARCCRYSCLRSWWWVMVPPETCRAVSRQNDLCNVASCWIYIYIYIYIYIRIW